ncbi:hypothetical protein ACFLY6_00795 [Candidatus Dependentiae bacterium]
MRFKIKFILFMSFLSLHKALPVWFIVHGVGHDIERYLPSGSFYETFQETVGKEKVETHTWHTKEFIKNTGEIILNEISSLEDQTSEAVIIAISAIQEAIKDTVQDELTGAKMIQRIMGAYALAIRTVDAIAEGDNVNYVCTSFGGHVGYGATQLLSDIHTTDDIITPESVIAIFTPIIKLMQGQPTVKKISRKLLGIPKNCCNWCSALSACCAERLFNYHDALEKNFKDEVAVWAVCHQLVSKYKNERLGNGNIKIDRIATIATPAVRGAFMPNDEIIGEIRCLYSKGDLIAMGVGSQRTPKQINIRMKISETGHCNCDNPTHTELCGNPNVARLIPALFQYNTPGKITLSDSGHFVFEPSRSRCILL